MKTNIGLSDKEKQGCLKILDRVLSDEYVLYTKTRNYHWNITGPDFSELHKFFEAQYTELNIVIDDVAERARALGGRSLGSLAEFLKETRLKEDKSSSTDSKHMLKSLLADHEALIHSLRKDVDACTDEYHDAGTADFLTGLMEQHEKMAWMLRAYLS